MSEILSHPIPAVVGLLGLLIFVHEFGHYIVGRSLGIAVEIFSIGFGPQIMSWTRRGINYRLSWIPLGGYVKFAGSHPSEDVPPDCQGIAYRDASIGARALTIAAGPLANFILAAVVFAILGGYGIPHPPPLVGEVIDGSRAEMAGMKPGDQIVEIDGVGVKTWRELEQKISSSPEKQLVVKVLRQDGLDQKQVSLILTPAEVPVPGWMGSAKGTKVGRAGIALGQLPPIITVKDPSSLAARSTLGTGDRILEVALWEISSPQEAAQGTPLESITIKSFWALREALATFVTRHRQQPEKALHLQLTVQRTKPMNLDRASSLDIARDSESSKKSSDSELGEVRKVFIDLKSLPLSAQATSLTSREILDVVGIEDSQLTLGQIPERYRVLESGDVLLRFGTTPVRNIYQLREALLAHQDPQGQVVVLRNGEEKVFEVPLDPVEVQKMEGKVTHYGFPVGFWVQLSEPEPYIEKYSLGGAIGFGVLETLTQAKEMTINVGQLVTGQIPMKALGGPMLIAKVAGDSAKRGWQTFLGALALISINLGVLNLFPIPVLDGGQLMMVAWEAIRRRPVGELALENFQKVGFAMILALVVLATYNDLSRFWLSMLSSVVGIFK